MIVNYLVTAILGLATWLISFLPAGSPWTPDVSGASSFLGSLYGLDAYFPITEMMTCLGIAIIVMNASALFAVPNWVWRRLRG